MAVGGLVCGILGLALGGTVLSPLAIIFGCLGIRRANQGARHRRMAWADICLGIVGAIATVIFYMHNMYYL